MKSDIILELEKLSDMWAALEKGVVESLRTISQRNLPLDNQLRGCYEKRLVLVRQLVRGMEDMADDASEAILQNPGRTARSKRIASVAWDMGPSEDEILDQNPQGFWSKFFWNKSVSPFMNVVTWAYRISGIIAGSLYIKGKWSKEKQISALELAITKLDEHKFALGKAGPQDSKIRNYIQTLDALTLNISEEIHILSETSALNF